MIQRRAAVPAPAPVRRPVFTERAVPGVQLSETLRGQFEWVAGADRDARPEDDIGPWARAMSSNAAAMAIDVSIRIDDVEHFVSNWEHEARLIGTVTAPSLSEAPMQIRDGRFNLFIIDPERVETRYMRYRMMVTSPSGFVYHIQGTKLVRKASWRTLWSALTTLYVTVHEDGTGRRAHGILRLSARDFIAQLASMRATDTHGFGEGVDVCARLIGFFLGVVRSMYGGFLARAIVATVDAPPRPRRPLRITDEYGVRTTDWTHIRLTRYRGGDRGPVMLAPGFSVSASSFAADTVDENLVESLLREKYDVWLLDYRASSSFPAAGTSFSIDDIAKRDYPAAVEFVLRERRVDDVQIVAHCVGALSLLMSLAGDALKPEWIRSVICSQLGLHPVAPPLAELKASFYLAAFLRRLGVATVSADFNPYWLSHRVADKLLNLYPTDERCNNPACRRILLLLGESFRHDQLNTATHDTISDWFGTASVQGLAHLSLMLDARKALDRDGRDIYVGDAELRRLKKVPISFIHGTLNREFLPESTQQTYDRLCAVNGPRLYCRQLFPGYGHMDCFIGRNAARDIFPYIIGELEVAPRRRG